MIPNFQKSDDQENTSSTLRLEPEIVNEVTAVIYITGYIDTYNSDFFTKQVRVAIREGYVHIVLGCEGLTYISSTGVGAFTALLKEVGKQGSVSLAAAPLKVLEVFQLLGFASFFSVYPDIDSAKKAAVSGGVSKADLSALFPLSIECPICSKKLKAAKPGTFRCPECKTGLIVNEVGEMTLR